MGYIPPLPFAGNKNMWASELKAIAKDIPENKIVIDIFGGSGVCSRIIKDARPDLTVVYNDFDGYSERLDHVEETEALRHDLSEKFGFSNDFCRKLTSDEKKYFFSKIDQSNFVDKLALSSWLTLGCSPCEFKNRERMYYSRVPKTPINIEKAHKWCDGLVVTKSFFEGLKTAYEINGKSVLLGDLVAENKAFCVIDPPYLATTTDMYKSKESLTILNSIFEVCDVAPFVMFYDSSLDIIIKRCLKGLPVRFDSKLKGKTNHQTKRSRIEFICTKIYGNS